MSVSQEQLKIMQAHLAAMNVACPLCTTEAWEFTAMVTATVVKPQPDVGTGQVVWTQGLGPQRTIIPMALLVCRRCFYTMQLAWAPIQKRANEGFVGTR